MDSGSDVVRSLNSETSSQVRTHLYCQNTRRASRLSAAWPLWSQNRHVRDAKASVWEYGAADRGAVASGGIAEAVAERSIQSQGGTEGCLTRPDGKAVVISCGTRIGPDGTVSRALDPARENIYALE